MKSINFTTNKSIDRRFFLKGCGAAIAPSVAQQHATSFLKR